MSQFRTLIELSLQNVCVRLTGYLAVYQLTNSHPSGALAQAFTSDKFGRRGSIIIWAGIFTIGVAVQTGTTYSITQITVGRFVAGLGVGALSGT